ncbi:group II intron reverse transcriptase/maturase [Paenibacillus ginsengarvi]|uniref:Group II intron reverse transcriptase/maturase n=1 Tax=Paenibacillus ginsengarvi TaxID=400777 RepID=A0A3B0AHI7_9BACL|nr:group II intron reverse transcriptase/maturase [Paenibacillus ginsengarvi]RKN59704.1 group II intron reverse transcriptase/maturase [Paenibacillus ginsengarvi]
MNAEYTANATNENARQLQNTLYLAAKANPKRKFHALYDKLFRKDILWEAWTRVKTNRGSAGVDGQTIEHIVREYGEETFVEEIRQHLADGTYRPSPVKRKEIPKPDGKTRPLGIPTVRDRTVQMATKLVIEGIFEADFKDCSYGFRPKRSAHNAITCIRDSINWGVVNWVVDVDITGYFDNISHSKLLKLVEERICDRRILKLIRQWLEAGVMKEGIWHKTQIGSPQGGVISPLLANIYLNYLDTMWEKRFSHLGKLVRYADDLVILCRYKPQALETIRTLKAIFGKLELTMNTSKSRLVCLWKNQDGFDFLGFHHRKMPYLHKKGTVYRLRSFPSKKAMKKMRLRVKEETASRGLLNWPLNRMVDFLNPMIQGWRNYYAHLDVDRKTSNRFLAKVDWYILRRMRLFWNKKHRKRKMNWSEMHSLLQRTELKTVCTWVSRTALGEERRKAVCGKTARTV